jgi:hypothetical protein
MSPSQPTSPWEHGAPQPRYSQNVPQTFLCFHLSDAGKRWKSWLNFCQPGGLETLLVAVAYTWRRK